ncbi:MAG: HEPN domain-containing protein [Candidatus Heimdallarchaeota archaeon]
MTNEIIGKWWLPNKPDEKVSGKLTIGEDSIHLKIEELLPVDSKSKSFDIILGEDANQQKITLYETHLPHETTKNIWATYVLFGSHFEKKDEIKFTNLSFRFQNFAEWMNKDVINVKYVSEEETNVNVSGYSFEYNFTNLKIIVKYIPQYVKTGTTLLTIKHDPLIILEFNEPILLEDYMKFVWSLQDFFILLTNRKIRPFGYRTHSKTDNKDISIVFQESKEPRVEHYFGEEIPFTKIKDNLNVYLNNWMQKENELKSACDLFLGLIYSDVYSEFKLLAYTQIIESYHRNIIGGEFLSESKYEPIKQILTKAIPGKLVKNHKDSLKSRIKYGYEYSLRKRLKDIIKKYWNDYLSQFINDKNLFENQVIETRNYLTHYSDSGKKQFILKDEKLVHLNLKLKLLCHVLLLVEIGISKELITLFIKNSGTKYQIEYFNEKLS